MKKINQSDNQQVGQTGAEYNGEIQQLEKKLLRYDENIIDSETEERIPYAQAYLEIINIYKKILAIEVGKRVDLEKELELITGGRDDLSS